MDQNSSNANALTALTGAWSNVKQKWSESSAPGYVDQISQQIPQETKDMISETRAKVFNPDHIRSPKAYLGIGEDRPFYVESNPSLLMGRVKHNLQYFYLNYILVGCILFVLTLLVSPTSIVGMVLLGAAWFYVLKVTESGSVTIRGATIPQKPVLVVMAVISFFVLSYILSSVFWYTACMSFICAGGHSIFRDSTLLQDEDDKVNMEGDLGEDSAFLGGAGGSSGSLQANNIV